LLEEHPGEIITLTRIFMIFASVMLIFAVLPLYASEKMPFEDSDSIETIQQKILQNVYNFTVKPNSIFNLPPEGKINSLKEGCPR
jgi:hypothetical protein